MYLNGYNGPSLVVDQIYYIHGSNKFIIQENTPIHEILVDVVYFIMTDSTPTLKKDTLHITSIHKE